MRATAAPARTKRGGGVSAGRTTPGARHGWDALRVMLALALLTYVWRFTSLFPIFATLQVTSIATIGALVLFLAGKDVRRVSKRFRHPVVKCIIALTALMVVLVPFGLYPTRSFGFLRVDHLKTVGLILIIAASIRSMSDVEKFVGIHVFGAVVYSLMILYKFQVAPGAWRLGDLYYYDANDLAFILVCTVPMAVYFMQTGRTPVHRLLAVFALGVLTMTLVKTGSRGGFLGIMVVSIYLLVGFRVVKPHVRLAFAGAVVVGIAVFAGPRYWEQMKTIFNPTTDYNWSGQDEGGRMEIWRRGVGYVAARPIRGTGAGQFRLAEGRLAERAEFQQFGHNYVWSAPHNSFLQIAVEVGVGGFLLFMAILLFSFKAMRRVGRLGGRGRKPPPEVVMAQALIGTLVAYCIVGFFLSQAYAVYIYSVFALVVGLDAVAPQTAAPQPMRRPRQARRGNPVPHRATA